MGSLIFCSYLLAGCVLVTGIIFLCASMLSSQKSREEEALGLGERGEVQTGWGIVLFLFMFVGSAAVALSSPWPWWYTLVTIAPAAGAAVLLAWRAARGQV